MLQTQTLLEDIKRSLDSHILFDIPIGGDFDNLLKNPVYATPLTIEKYMYDYGDFKIERYKNTILAIRIPAINEIQLSNVIEVFGEGETHEYGPYYYVSYASDQVIAAFKFSLEDKSLFGIDVASTIFMD